MAHCRATEGNGVLQPLQEQLALSTAIRGNDLFWQVKRKNVTILCNPSVNELSLFGEVLSRDSWFMNQVVDVMGKL